jgi:hypothetical protein
MAGLELRDERRVRTCKHSQKHVLYHRYVYMAPFEARVSANERFNYLYYVRDVFITAGLHHAKRSVKYPVGRFTIVERRTRRIVHTQPNVASETALESQQGVQLDCHFISCAYVEATTPCAVFRRRVRFQVCV